MPVNEEKWGDKRQSFDYFVQGVKKFLSAEDVGRKARRFLVMLIIFMIGTNGLSVTNSYVAGAFMTAIENRNFPKFVMMAFFYIGVFAGSTLVSVIYSYTEQRLGLLWREWATRESVSRYANFRTYYGLKKKGEVGNPDQRISEDVRTFTTTTLSFLLMLLNSTFTVIAFSGVLWSISHLLFVVSILYAVAGSFLTFVFGRPLVKLNYDQMDKEANFRSSLLYLRSNADSIALSRREGGLIQLNLRNLGDLVSNYRRIITVNRNVSFFTTGYNWMIQIIPALIVAPLFIRGKMDFGVITQSAIAFSQLVGAISLIVSQIQSITSYAATSARLGSMTKAAKEEKSAALRPGVFTRDPDRIAYQGLTLRSPRSGRVLIQKLSVDIPQGRRVLIRGKDDSARAALFYATAGLFDVTEGHIVRPALDQILFLPESPYLPPSTIRELLLRPWPEEQGKVTSQLEAIQVPDELMLETLRVLQIDSLLAGFGGLDKRHHWENILPLEEQQLLVIARVLISCPRFVFLDRLASVLHNGRTERILDLLRERSIGYVLFADEGDGVNPEKFDSLLQLDGTGAWTWNPGKGNGGTDDAARSST